MDGTIFEHKIEIEDLLGKAEESTLVAIPKVPATLRNILGFPKWIEPCMISIGPYYHGNHNLQEGEKFKLLGAKRFIEDSKQNVLDLYQKIESQIQELKNFYDNKEIVGCDDKKLVEMFLLDGCFLLHFICCFYGTNEGGSNFTNHRIAYIEQDLFLLENQLPFEVLRLLIEGAQHSDNMKRMIEDFIISKITTARGNLKTEENEAPFHLLDLLRGVLLGKVKKISKKQVVGCQSLPERKEAGEKGHTQGPSKWPIQFSPIQQILGFRNMFKEEKHEKHTWHSHKNVQELKSVGIHFKPSETSFLTDISFTSYFGITGCLRLPPVTIDSSTMIIFLNLIAQESSSNLNDFSVISYLCFLDSLIDHWEDVKELQAARVLHNFVGDKKEVAQFFNHICGKLLPDFNIYKHVNGQIQRHVQRNHNSKLRMWLIQCKHTYFSSPWSVIALAGALVGLFLTAVQTYTSVFSPSKS